MTGSRGDRVPQRVVDGAQRVVTTPCRFCASPFEPVRPFQTFCSSRCRWQAFKARRASARAAAAPRTEALAAPSRTRNESAAADAPGDFAAADAVYWLESYDFQS